MISQTIYIFNCLFDEPLALTYGSGHPSLLGKIRVRFKKGYYCMSEQDFDILICDKALEAYKNKKKSITL